VFPVFASGGGNFFFVLIFGSSSGEKAKDLAGD
jgi:hypothetical protein